jgi:hypothetical protein
MTNVEMERLWDGLYALAGVAVDGYLAQSTIPMPRLRAKPQIAEVPAEPRRDRIVVLESSSVEGKSQ